MSNPDVAGPGMSFSADAIALDSGPIESLPNQTIGFETVVTAAVGSGSLK